MNVPCLQIPHFWAALLESEGPVCRSHRPKPLLIRNNVVFAPAYFNIMIWHQRKKNETQKSASRYIFVPCINSGNVTITIHPLWTHWPAVVSLISRKQFSPAIWVASNTDRLSASVKKFGTYQGRAQINMFSQNHFANCELCPRLTSSVTHRDDTVHHWLLQGTFWCLLQLGEQHPCDLLNREHLVLVQISYL